MSNMDDIKEFLDFVTHEYTDEEKAVYPVIIKYIEDKYNIKVYKVRYEYNNITSLFEFFFKTTDERNKFFYELENIAPYDYNFTSETQYIAQVIKRKGLQQYFHTDKIKIVRFSSFEYDAIHWTYYKAFEDFKGFKDKYFNTKTMKHIASDMLYVVYKTKELMDQAKESGEQEFLRNEYYKFMKKYDRFNLITPQKHLLAFFDYWKPEMTGRYFYDLYWKLLAE